VSWCQATNSAVLAAFIFLNTVRAICRRNKPSREGISGDSYNGYSLGVQSETTLAISGNVEALIWHTTWHAILNHNYHLCVRVCYTPHRV
jgi:hypothetical protein